VQILFNLIYEHHLRELNKILLHFVLTNIAYFTENAAKGTELSTTKENKPRAREQELFFFGGGILLRTAG
jgi:hypothetical protein